MSVVFCSGEVAVIDQVVIDRLKHAAARAVKRRARVCLHGDEQAKVHEMIIAFRGDAYVRPHRHLAKSESFHVVEGELMLFFFDDAGSVRRPIRLGASGTGHPFMCRLGSEAWHTVLPLTEWVVVHETTCGPFDRRDTEPSDWAPPEEDLPAVGEFLARLRAFC